MTFLRDFFDESFLRKGGKSGAPKLPKMFVFDLKKKIAQKHTKNHQTCFSKKLDIGGSTLDTFQDCENIRDLAFRSIRQSIFLDSRL